MQREHYTRVLSVYYIVHRMEFSCITVITLSSIDFDMSIEVLVLVLVLVYFASIRGLAQQKGTGVSLPRYVMIHTPSAVRSRNPKNNIMI